MTNFTIKIKVTDLNEGSDYQQHEVKSGEEYGLAMKMAREAVKRNGIMLDEAASRIVIETVQVTNESLADLLGL